MLVMAIDPFPSIRHTPSEEAAELSQILDATLAEAAVQRAEFAQALSACERTSAALMSEIAAKQQIIASYEMQIKDMKQELDAVYCSSSWRITAPLRSAVTLLKGLRSKAFELNMGQSTSSSRLEPVDEGSLPAGPSRPKIQPPALENSGSETSSRSTAPAMSKLIVIDQLNTSAEAETVQRIYRQFTRARKQALENN
jgi:hypothetical protein